MHTIKIPLGDVDDEFITQLDYALSFAAEEIGSYRIDQEARVIEAQVAREDCAPEAKRKIEELVQRYQKREFGLARAVHFEQTTRRQGVDAWSGLLERKWVTPVGQGHVILRGAAAQLAGAVHARIDRVFGKEFKIEQELYPATILCKTLDRIHHFTSFPEHIDFVANLKPDLDTLNAFSTQCREEGWTPKANEGRYADTEFAICPSCCYHCYEGMEGWNLELPGRCTTMTVACHRYEGANHRTMSRLRAFTQRDVVWVGQPKFVLESRAKAEQLIVQWAKDWELTCSFETANDMFFTQDYAVKASFQRQQQAKKELRLLIPAENQTISVFSSNFHAMTFGKAFNILAGGKPATSACVGWGIERWVYALFSQFGFDMETWPKTLRDEFEAQKGGRY